MLLMRRGRAGVRFSACAGMPSISKTGGCGRAHAHTGKGRLRICASRTRRELEPADHVTAAGRRAATRTQGADHASVLAYGRDYLRDPYFLVFPNMAAQCQPPHLDGRLRRIMPIAGVERIQPCHGWRHTMATSMIRNGVDLKTVSTRLGHSTTAITNDLYVHPEDVRDRAAAEVIGAHFSALTKG